ncbi:MAG: PepSY domain-containing protein [Kiritimatiellae bacterium]|nr:PepSY domain-containing protein [Kiritimatiellia bacterium]
MNKLIILCAAISAAVAYSSIAQTAAPVQSGCQTCCKTACKTISKEAAINAALAHAGVKRSDVRDLSCELDRENGVLVYDIEFEVGSMEYDYDIDAKTGAVLKAWKERD